jgi:hypothetical protein
MERRAPAADWTAWPIVVGAIWALSVFVTVVVIDIFHTHWKYALIPLPVVLLGYFALVLWRTIKRPDPMRVDAPDIET